MEKLVRGKPESELKWRRRSVSHGRPAAQLEGRVPWMRLPANDILLSFASCLQLEGSVPEAASVAETSKAEGGLRSAVWPAYSGYSEGRRQVRNKKPAYDERLYQTFVTPFAELPAEVLWKCWKGAVTGARTVYSISSQH